MLTLETNNRLPAEHTRTCYDPSPPPAPPPRTPPAVCEAPAPPTSPPAPICDDPNLIEHRYFDERHLITQGPAPQNVSDCPAWCTAQVEIDCEARVAFQLSETFGCGYDPGVSRCGLFAADPLVILNISGLWAREIQCNCQIGSIPWHIYACACRVLSHHPRYLSISDANR